MRLAVEMKRQGQAPGVSLEQLVQNIMLPAGPGQTANPQPEGVGGVFNAATPTQVAQLLGPATAPPPVVVTPGSRAPEKEGVEIKAPPPPQQYENPYLLLARQQRQKLEAMAAPGENATVDQVAAYNLLKAKAARAQAEADVTQAAQIRPEEEQIFAGRESRAGERLAELQKERKSSKWKALAEAGFKMAQSNSPYFMQALASGMEAGVKGYDARKAKMDEEQSLLKDQSENVKLARIKAIDAARAQALDAYRGGDRAALQDLQMLEAARADTISGKTAESRVEAANLVPKVTLASIAKDEAAAEAYRAAADKDRRTDPNLRSSGGGGGGGGGGMGAKGATGTLNGLIRQEGVYQRTINDPLTPKAQKDEARAALKKVRMEIAWVKASMGLPGGQAAAPTGGGAPQATMQYVPGKGLQPVR
jgi:hypothetical protein